MCDSSILGGAGADAFGAMLGIPPGMGTATGLLFSGNGKGKGKTAAPAATTPWFPGAIQGGPPGLPPQMQAPVTPAAPQTNWLTLPAGAYGPTRPGQYGPFI